MIGGWCGWWLVRESLYISFFMTMVCLVWLKVGVVSSWWLVWLVVGLVSM